jgi:hypothetical protein
MSKNADRGPRLVPFDFANSLVRFRDSIPRLSARCSTASCSALLCPAVGGTPLFVRGEAEP